MIRYKPAFILHNYERGNMQGKINGFILHMDLNGFTHICSDLQKMGKPGAEILGKIIQRLVGAMLHNLDTHCGFFFRFAGDAYYVFFPEKEPLHALAATLANREYIRENGVFPSPIGELRIKARQSIGYGTLDWRIYQNELKNEYVFHGPVIQEVHELSEARRELVFSRSAAQKIGMKHFRKAGDYLEPADQMIEAPLCRLEYEFDPDTAKAFMNRSLLDVHPDNEMRPVACCFINLEYQPDADFGNVLQTLELLAVTYGGHVNNLVNARSGFQEIVLFGMPRSEGNSMQRACRFALEIKKALPRTSLGMSYGNVLAVYIKGQYCGEYTALGPTVNLASRLAAKANPGEILIEASFQKALADSFIFEARGTTKLKGVGQKIRYFNLVEAFSRGFTGYRGSFVGREEEFQHIRDWVQDTLGERGKSCACIYGEAGIGKTRLAGELLDSFSDEECAKYRLYCDMITTKTLEPVKQLIHSHLGINTQKTDEKAVEIFRRRWRSWAGKDEKLKQAESLIGALLGYFWIGSRWDILAPEVRFKEMLRSWQLMIARIAAEKPLLIQFDDIQWIDSQSLSFFRSLKDKRIKGVCIIATSRYLEDGRKPDLGIKDFSNLGMELKPLALPERIKLIKYLLMLKKLPSSTQEVIKQRSSGNPFYIEQFVSWILENKKINTRGEFLFDPDLDPPSPKLSRINEIIISRVDRLTQKVRECVENASVLGLSFNIKVLSNMLNSDPRRDLENGAKNRIWKDLDEVNFIFSHWLIRDAIYERMLSDKLRKLHLAAANAMERVYELDLDRQAEEIALHFEKAGVLDRAADYYERAGDHNWDLMYLERSEANMKKAIELCAQACGRENMKYGRKIFNLALLYHYLLRIEEAEPLYDEVIRLATSEYGENGPEMSPYLNNLGRFYKDVRRFEEGEKYLRKSLAIERKLSPGSSNVADRINNIGHLYAIMNKPQEAAEFFREALDIVDKNYPPDFWFTAVCAGNLGKMYIDTGRLDEAEPLLNRALEIATHYWGSEHVSSALYRKRLGDLYLAKGDHRQAGEYYEQALAVYSRSFGEKHPRTKPILDALEKLQSLADHDGLKKNMNDS